MWWLALARIITAFSHTVCAVLSSVCATTADNSGVYVCYLKGMVSICFRCPARSVGFSGTCLYLCTYNHQAQVLPTSWLGRSTRRLQPGGHVHKEVVHLLSPQPASTTSSGAFKPECNGLLQFRENTGGPSMPVRECNLIACPLVQPSWKTPFQTFWSQAGDSPQPIRPAGTVAYSLV